MRCTLLPNNVLINTLRPTSLCDSSLFRWRLSTLCQLKNILVFIQLVFLLVPSVIFVAARWHVFSPTCLSVPGATIPIHSSCKLALFKLYKNFIKQYAFWSELAEDSIGVVLHIPTLIHSFMVTGILPPQPFFKSNSRRLKSSGHNNNNNNNNVNAPYPIVFKACSYAGS